MRGTVCGSLLATFCCFLLCCKGREVIVHPVATNCTLVQCGSNVSASEVQNTTTLDEALGNISSDTTLYLQPGCHCVEQFSPVYDLQNIALVGNGSRSEVTVSCASGFGLAFANISGLSIENITIEACGLSDENLTSFRNAIGQYINFFFQLRTDYEIALLCGGCSDFSVHYSAIKNTKGLGLLGINTMGNSHLHEVEFSQNIAEGCFFFTQDLTPAVLGGVGGGALFIYVDYFAEYNSINLLEQSRLTIENCYFLKNSYCGLETIYELYYRFSEVARNAGYFLGAGGGLSVIITQVNYTVNVSVESCTFRNNTARYGGGTHVEIFSGVSDSHVLFSNCSFDKNGIDTALLPGGVQFSLAAAAMALFFDFGRPNITENIISSRLESNSITVINTNFTDNRAFSAGAVLLESLHFSDTVQHLALFENCRFERNIAVYAAAFFAVEAKPSLSHSGLTITLKNTNVNNNTVFVQDATDIQSATDTSSILEAATVNLTIAGSSRFTNNSGTAIRCTGSTLEVRDNLHFSGNVGAFGGALRLTASSLLVVRNHTYILFQNNTGANVGGAIYADYLASGTAFFYLDCVIYFGALDILCLSDFITDCIDITTMNVTIEFSDNSAPLGSIMYGSTLETCPWGKYLRQQYAPNSTSSLLELLYYNISSPFEFGTPPDNVKVVTTPASEVRVMEVNPDHSVNPNHSVIYSVIPGQKFNLSVIGLDRFGRTIPVVLQSKVTGPSATLTNTSSKVGDSGFWFTGTDNSTSTPITIYGQYDQQKINVTLFTVTSFAQTEFTVNLLNCSKGFDYEEDSCKCDSRLASASVFCDPSTKLLTVPNGLWIGTAPDGQLVVQPCVQNYCKVGEKVVKPNDFDSQCSEGYNRTGILCGECVEKYSVVFGSNRCHKCSNSGLWWILFFASSGIAIILCISFLHLTISEGFLNGVLFYCNIVSLYVPYFTPDSPVTQLFVLIAFLNLDLGIETCFYSGMDSLSRAWLHFVYPLYLYILMISIIILARRSDRITRRFSRSGYSAANLFATLIMMSYTSLLQNCAEVLGFVVVSTLSGESSVRWAIDPNVEYFKGAHAPLGIIAVILLAFFIIPVPFLLMFPACALTLKIVKRFMPIYDAFWAPFKPNFRFWIGFRLLLRFIPFCFAYLSSYPLNVVLLGIFLVILLFVQVMVWPFKGTAQNAFDIMFICNILIMCLGALFFAIYTTSFQHYAAESSRIERWQYIYIGITASVGYIGFALILIWHLILRFPSLKSILMNLLQNLKLGFSKRSLRIAFQKPTNYGATPEYEPLNSSSDDSDSLTEEVRQPVNYSELREPLLDEGSVDLTPRTI